MTIMRDHEVDLPPTREACRERLAELTTEVSAIKTGIAAADLERQRRRGKVDPQQFQACRTALLDKQREIQRITVLRADYDDTAWQAALERAGRLTETKGTS